MAAQKHHYIPEFYLKRWTGRDGRLTEFSRRHFGKVIARRTHPGGTGYVRGLYTMNAFPPEIADIVENRLMSGVDDSASRALSLLEKAKIDDLTAELRTGWAIFIISLWRRTPEALAKLEAGLGQSFTEHNIDIEPPDQPGSEDEARERKARFQREHALLLQNLITSRKIGTHIINMRWSVARFSNFKHPLLTSDRPFVMTNGISQPNAHIAVPIGPDRCFLATNTVEGERYVSTIPAVEFMHQINDRMGCQARRFVYGIDDSQLRFVANRLGRQEPAAPGDGEV